MREFSGESGIDTKGDLDERNPAGIRTAARDGDARAVVIPERHSLGGGGHKGAAHWLNDIEPESSRIPFPCAQIPVAVRRVIDAVLPGASDPNGQTLSRRQRRADA